jgi:HSP20 family protein
MTLVRWDPFRDLFDIPSRLARTTAGGDDVLSAWAPRVDIFEKDDALVLHAELPGIEKSDLDVRVEDGTLTLEGERKRESAGEDGNVYRRERYYGRFVRSFKLPTTVDASKIAATYKDGVLEVRLPKVEAAKPRKVEIQAA